MFATDGLTKACFKEKGAANECEDGNVDGLE